MRAKGSFRRIKEKKPVSQKAAAVREVGGKPEGSHDLEIRRGED